MDLMAYLSRLKKESVNLRIGWDFPVWEAERKKNEETFGTHQAYKYTDNRSSRESGKRKEGNIDIWKNNGENLPNLMKNFNLYIQRA